MEKSSEKLIRDNTQKRNPFNAMLSEVHIKLPSPDNKKKKPQNIALEYDPYIDRNSYKEYQEENHQATPKFKRQLSPNLKQNHAINIHAPMKTKNSSNTPEPSKTREQLIKQWIVDYIRTQQILGLQWEDKLQKHQKELLLAAFISIKNYNNEHNYTFHFSIHPEQQQIEEMVTAISNIHKKHLKSAFQQLLKHLKDSILFGLSNTIEEDQENKNSHQDSLLLKINSDCGASKKLLKQYDISRKNSDQDISIDQQSFKLKSHKASYSATPSEDLSALILNHNKLHLQGELNNSHPNLPRSMKNTSKKNLTNKQIGSIALQTNKKINSNRKLDNDLPLDSRKNLSNKLIKMQANDSLIDKIKEESTSNVQPTPVTITYILKNLELKQASIEQQNPKNEERKEYPDFINRVPVAESFYTPAAALNLPLRNVFCPAIPQGQENRSISLQVKPQPRYISPEKAPQAIRIINSNQYYPEQVHRRQSFRQIRQEPPNPYNKQRAHSATPKIRFTFTTNQAVFQQLIPQNINQISNPPTNYDQKDCIKENSTIYNPQQLKQSGNFISNDPSKNSHFKDSKTNTKIRNSQRQHIKDLILPSTYDEYYTNSSHHQPHNQKNSIKVPILSGSNTSTSPRSNCKDNQQYDKFIGRVSSTKPLGQPPFDRCIKPFEKCSQGRAKSPKEKILVTCSSKGRI